LVNVGALEVEVVVLESGGGAQVEPDGCVCDGELS
jgi:hypothetical protein